MKDVLLIQSSTKPGRRVQLVMLPSLAALVVACHAIGDDTPANLGSTDSEQVSVAPPVEPFALEASRFVGRWVGVAEDALAFDTEPGAPRDPYRFPSGSSQIVLDLFDTGGIAVGTLTFGEGSVPPTALDPDVGFPVGLDYAELLGYPLEGAAAFTGRLAFDRGQLPPHEGFPYDVVRPDASPESPAPDGLLRLTYFTNQVLQDWCALQTPIPTPYGTFTCNAGVPIDDLESGGCKLLSFPEWCYDPSGECEFPPLEDLGPVDCDKAFLCEDTVPRCDCVEVGCSAASQRAELVVRPVGEELIGVIGGAAFQNDRHARAPLGAIRFRREP